VLAEVTGEDKELLSLGRDIDCSLSASVVSTNSSARRFTSGIDDCVTGSFQSSTAATMAVGPSPGAALHLAEPPDHQMHRHHHRGQATSH